MSSAKLQSPNLQSSIRHQVRLPFSVAFDVVLQGIRIRLGRAVVTLMGVVLGIAFLMSILTGQTLRQGVSREADARADAARMMNFLVAEIGPVEGRVLGVVALGPLQDMERRLLGELVRGKVRLLQWSGPPESRLPAGLAQPVAEGAVGRGAAAVLVLGEGTAPRTPWDELLRGAEQRVVAAGRQSHAVPAGGNIVAVCLERAWQPEELAARAAMQKRLRFRTGWVIAISLLVTVIGIANAMLMSVTERFREIGTMKCLGALSQFIRQVFFIEACLMGAVGSLAGGLFGVLFAMSAYGLTYGFDLVLASMSAGPLLLHGAVSVTAGVVLSILAAIYPAGVASRMVPAMALRSNV